MFSFRETLKNEIKELKDNGLFKNERVITTDQQTTIRTETTGEVINFCANNYLGLANDPRVIDAAKKTMDTHGFGLASVRFICGTQDIHKQLERTISEFLGKEDTILYAAAFDANGGLFEPLFTEEDALISDELNHASIIDGIRLCKAQRFRYKHNNMDDLEAKLQEASKARRRIIITDGAFSMDGTVAQMDKICALAQKYDALVMTDECHSMGFMGKTGRGVPEHCGVLDQVDIITGTLGKALGGGSGGFTSGPKEIIDLLRQRSRPYLFSNTLAPAIVGASLEVFNIIGKTTELRDQLETNTEHFRKKITEAGFDIKPGNHPIVPIMLYDAALAQKMAEKLLAEGIYVIGFYYPVVAKGQARIRVQISAKHTMEQLNKAIDAFTKIGKELGVIN